MYTTEVKFFWQGRIQNIQITEKNFSNPNPSA